MSHDALVAAATEVNRTFLFSDIERSTQLLQLHGRAMGDALARHHELFEDIVARHGGSIFETVGDAVYAAFSDPSAAVSAALDAQIALADEDWGAIGRLNVRIALHTGDVDSRGTHYFGPALFRVARLQALAHGEQTLLSRATASLISDRLPDGASLQDLGTHRLKDLHEPERVYQLIHPRLRAEFPALRSLDSRPHNLPLQLSTFIGRETELRELTGLLDEHRLVTLVGPAGIGKTRLALQVAAEQLERHRDGVFFVDLAPLRDPALLSATIGASLGLREEPGQSMDATVAEYLHDRELLLVLDNLEQLLPGASAAVGRLLVHAPALAVVTTSRAPLRIRGEHEYPVEPLAFDGADVGAHGDAPAVELFLDRARALRPDLVVDARGRELIARICRRLDGLPLAIELAAARLRMFTLAVLDERLDRRLGTLTAGSRDLPERQQTLSAAIAWSEELLAPSQQALFAELGVFGGGFTLDAAESVAGHARDADVLSDLEALVEQSLVRRIENRTGEPRYGMLESIREYALNRLSDTEASEVQRRHLAHYLSLIAHERDFDVEDEIHNLRIGMSLAESEGNGTAILQMMIGTYAYWLEGAAQLSEASEWMHRGLSVLGANNAALRADALWRYAYFVDGLGDVPRAVSLSEEAAEIATRLGDDVLLARILRSLGVFNARLGLLERATEVLHQGLAHAEAAGDSGSQDRILAQLAEVASASSTVEATGLIARAIALARATGDRQRLAEGLETLGYFRLVAGDHEGARGPLEEAMSLLRDEAGYEDLTFALLSLAQARARGGDRGGAVALLAEALEYLGKASGPVSGQFFCLLLAGTLAELDDSDLSARLIGAADAAATANAVPFQRLERALRLRVLRAALKHRDPDTVRANVEAGCTDGWERTMAAVPKGGP